MKALKTIKQRLIDEPQDFKNDEDILHCFFSDKLKMFCLEFNAKLFTYKTPNGFISKRNKLISKHNLH